MSIFQSSSDRPDAILTAAWTAFAQYGYRRTSMEDIAKGAGISRAALYLHYRNKEDIFRNLAARYFEVSLDSMTAAFSVANGDTADQLAAAFKAKDGGFMELVLTSPHGSELLDAGFSISADIVAKGEKRIAVLLSEWLAKTGIPGDLGSPDELAQTIMAALKGLKTSSTDFGQYLAGQQRLARMVARAISKDRAI